MVEKVVGQEVSLEAAVALGMFGALTVGWREVMQGRRFLKKKKN